MLRQCLPAYTSRASITVSSSAVGDVRGTGLAAAATLPANPFAIEFGLIPNVGAPGGPQVDGDLYYSKSAPKFTI